MIGQRLSLKRFSSGALRMWNGMLVNCAFRARPFPKRPADEADVSELLHKGRKIS